MKKIECAMLLHYMRVGDPETHICIKIFSKIENLSCASPHFHVFHSCRIAVELEGTG